MNKKIVNSKAVMLAFFLVIVFWIIVMIIKNTGTAYKLIDLKYYPIQNNWENETTSNENLPIDLTKNDNTRELKNSIDNYKYSKDDILSIKTSLGKFDIYFDDKLVFSFEDDDYNSYKNIARAKIHFFKLPEDFHAKRIKIKASDLDNLKSKPAIYDVVLGSKSAIYNYYSNNEIILFLINLFLLVLSIIILIIGILIKIRKGHVLKNTCYIGLFMIFTTVYLILELNMTNCIIESNLFYNVTKFGCLQLMGFPILKLIKECLSKKCIKVMYISEVVYICILVLELLLSILQISDYRNMLPFTHLMFIILGITIVYILIKYRKELNKNDIIKAISIIVIFLCGAIDIVLYNLSLTNISGIFYEIGLSIFFIIQIKIMINTFFSNYKKSINADLYEKIAYTDVMTNTDNRAAYEKKIEYINENINNFSSIGCLIFDLNNLKEMNDTNGHKSGDALIINFTNILKENFINKKVYRTGGDEFVILLENISINDINNLIYDLYKNIEYNNKESEIKISVAYGMSFYNSKHDTGINEAIKRADYNMYKMKSKMKNKTLR